VSSSTTKSSTPPPSCCCKPATIALQLWTAAHGVALLISRPYLPWGDADEFAERVITATCYGHIISGLTDPDATPQQTVTWLKGLANEQHRR